MSTATVSFQQAFDLATRHLQAGELPQAERIYRQILDRYPHHADSIAMLGVIAFEVGHADAEALMRQAIALQPHEFYFNNLGAVLKHQGRYDEATACFRRAAELLPDYADALYNLGLMQLLHGNLPEGFALYEHRVGTYVAASMQLGLPGPRWDGGALAGRTLLLHQEQGLGDMIQYFRFAGVLLEREPGARLIVQCSPELERLFIRSLPRCRVVPSGSPLPTYDLQLPVMSLPFVLGTTAETIPARVPYLTINHDKERAWRQRLRDGTTALRVGLVWAGGRHHAMDRERSVGLPALAALGLVRGVRFYSLQKGVAARQAADLPGLALTDLGGELRDFDDTAALLANLDLLISVDTSVVHLAGALGKPVWMLLPFVPDWRWQLGRDDSPWYPSVELFRQPGPGEWGAVVARIAAELAAR